MDTAKILIQLRKQHALIEDVINCLERLARSRGRPRGRPPQSTAEIDTSDSAAAKPPLRPEGERTAVAPKKSSKRQE